MDTPKHAPAEEPGGSRKRKPLSARTSVSAEPLLIAGHVVARTSRRQLSGITVQALPPGSHTPIAHTKTDAAGAFTIELGDHAAEQLLANPHRTLLLAAAHDGAPLTPDDDAVEWTTSTADRLLTIEVDDSRCPSAEVWMKIDTVESLNRNQAAILARVAETPNGGWLFTIHPFQLLADIGVQVNEDVREEIIARNPHLSTPSANAYQAIRLRPGQSPITIRLNGLFERATTSS